MNGLVGAARSVSRDAHPSPTRIIVIACGLLGFLLIASVSLAQRGRTSEPFRYATASSFDGAFTFCRLAVRSGPYGDGGSWWVDYPRADINLPTRFAELTSAVISRDATTGTPNHVVVRLNDPLLNRCPFVMLTEPGSSFLDGEEAASLRQYLLKGGFLWVDDFWGTRAWANWAEQLGKAMPPSQYPPVDLPLDHILFHVLYDIRRIPQIPSINFWLGTGGRTSERGADSARAHVRVVFDEHARIMVLMTHNTDFGDAFEREGDNYSYFLTFAPEGYAFGVNTLIYAMTH